MEINMAINQDKDGGDRLFEKNPKNGARATRRVVGAVISIPLGLASCLAFYQAMHHEFDEHATWAKFSGDCANIQTEINADKREAKVIRPPGCHYTNSNY
jgi:hypothetical protein